MEPESTLFSGFDPMRLAVGDVQINTVVGGSGPPVLLLHGYPQTHAMWHAVAPQLAANHTVVAADLRGYGDSSKPPGGSDHAMYAKRAMALDQVEVMASLGFDRFAVVGHDRGGRVAHRMALDHPEVVTRIAVLDIAPTRAVLLGTDRHIATAYFHWFLMAQPTPFPERLIGADPQLYMNQILGGLGTQPAFDAKALAEYRRCFDPATVHASCEDYRAAATIDFEHDEADADLRVVCPLLALWGERGRMNSLFDVEAAWRSRADQLHCATLPCGHYLAEERPEETAMVLEAFLRG